MSSKTYIRKNGLVILSGLFTEETIEAFRASATNEQIIDLVENAYNQGHLESDLIARAYLWNVGRYGDAIEWSEWDESELDAYQSENQFAAYLSESELEEYLDDSPCAEGGTISVPQAFMDVVSELDANDLNEDKIIDVTTVDPDAWYLVAELVDMGKLQQCSDEGRVCPLFDDLTIEMRQGDKQFKQRTLVPIKWQEWEARIVLRPGHEAKVTADEEYNF
jgi:hypothetical protein